MSMKVLSLLLMLLVMALLIVGLVTIYSTTSDSGTQKFVAQCMWIGIGLACSVAIAFTPMGFLARYSWLLLLLVTLPLLYLACVRVAYSVSPGVCEYLPFVSGKIKGSFRWLVFGRYSLQPSEFAKFALLLFLSSYYGLLGRAHVGHFVRGFLVPSFISCVVLGLIALGKDLSTTCVTGVMVGGIMFCAGVKLRHMALLVVAGACLFAVMVLGNHERLTRITSFWNAEAQKQGDSYQLYLSKLALGGGGMTGRGYGQGVIKRGYLPERHTDFILSVWGEETGFVGILAVLACYLGLMVCLFRIGFVCGESVGGLLCIGFSLLVTFQAIVNIGVISGWGPTTGLTAPFVSYGGSSMLAMMMCVGLAFNVCRRAEKNHRLKRSKGSEYPTFSDLKSLAQE